MSKVYGLISEFAPVKEDASRVIIGYGMQPEADGEHATWYEVDFYKKNGKPSLDAIKNAVKADINARTDERILKGFVWNGINVWLSEENQHNFSEAQRIAAANPEVGIPATFKLGEDENGDPVYHTFETAEELTEFYLAAVAYVKQQLAIGWEEKDSIDWSLYDETPAQEPKKTRKSSK